MRRQLLPQLPLLMSLYPGFRPFEAHLYTTHELRALITAARKEGTDGQ